MNINDPNFIIKTKTENTIHFKKVELSNIVDQGKNSNDNMESYRRLAELADDFNMLVSAFGPLIGRILYWLPVSWKASAYIEGLDKANKENRKHIEWLLIDKDDKTIGELSLSQIEKERFDLSDELNDLKLYNVGVILHSDFQRKGIVTELSNSLFGQLHNLDLDIDGLFIATRPDNVGVNVIAKKLDFTFIKEMDVKRDGLIPCFSYNYIPTNIYVKIL